MPKPEDRERVGQWIAQMMGDRTGQAFAEDITATTGWKVDRSRVSRYAKATIPIGRDVIGHMSEYAAKKGYPPLDLSRPATPVDPMVAAIDRQTAAIEAQTAMLRELLERLVPQALTPDQQAWVQEQARSATRPRVPRPGTPAGTA